MPVVRRTGAPQLSVLLSQNIQVGIRHQRGDLNNSDRARDLDLPVSRSIQIVVFYLALMLFSTFSVTSSVTFHIDSKL